MSTELFIVQVVTQEGEAFSGEASSVVAPAEDGYVGIWANHAPLLTTLGTGKLTIDSPDSHQRFDIEGGFMEVLRNKATILVENLINTDSLESDY